MSSNLEEENARLIESVDAETRRRAANLCARGLTEMQISGVLLLSYEQVLAIKGTEEYKKKFSEEADRIIQEQFDRDEGWDAIETQSLEVLMQTLRFNKDPKFALLAAKTANTAERRSKNKSDPKILEAPAAGNQTNIIFLQLNKQYSQREGNMIDVTARPVQIPLKQSDIPSPKLVEEILGAQKHVQGAQGNTETELERMFRESGVVFDEE